MTPIRLAQRKVRHNATNTIVLVISGVSVKKRLKIGRTMVMIGSREIRKCENCQEEYEPGDAKFCSYECFQEHGAEEE